MIDHDTQASKLAQRMREAARRDSVADVARRLWFPCSTTRKYFDTGRPDLSFIVAFCEAYDVTPSWLIYGSGPKHWSQEQVGSR